MKQIHRNLCIALIFAVAIIVTVGMCRLPNDTVEAMTSGKTTIVWFEDLAAINGVPVNGSVPLTDGVYTATLIDGSDMSIVVEDGVWYFR